MKYYEKINKALGCLKSAKRFKILNLLLEYNDGLHFNEIAEELSIIPSTLEYHLRNLEKQNLITHFDNVYIKNAYSKLVWNLCESLYKLNPMIPYLKTHKLPINDPNFLLNFTNSNPIILPDLISMLTLMKELVTSKFSRFRIAGSFNLEFKFS
ncbi:MAG: ArsR family transcriptional regulator [Promethearchaeati archaeon]